MSYKGQDELEEAIVNFEAEKATRICRVLLSSGVSADKVFDVISRSMDIVGEKYEGGEYFLAELITAGEAVKEVLKVVESFHKRSEEEYVGRVVLATVRGDLHDIGKNIVAMLLRSAGFKVYDIGVDKPPEKIVEVVKESGAQIVGLSALLTTTSLQIKNVTEELEMSGLRDKVKVIVGGAGVNEDVAERFGADAYAKTATDGLKICRRWVSSV